MRIPILLVMFCCLPCIAMGDPPAPEIHADMAHGGMNHADMIVSKTPRIMTGYGSGGFPITTKVQQAQAFFNNGMQLAHAFAHTAAIAAMTEAVRLDPQCAMCLWGEAWASGPTINYGKSVEALAPLAEEADHAAKLAVTAGTDRERALIHALQLRYQDGGGGKPADLAFAKAMTTLAMRYPADDEIAVLAADAWLMTEAHGPEEWKLNAQLVMPLLEGVLKRDSDNTAAIHFYIHATELADVPALAEQFADRLPALAPKASHLIHMPSHTYYWIGRYQDAAEANMRAVEIGIADAKELGLPPPEGVWGLPYHAHNVTYGLGGALESGDAKIALTLGRPLVMRAAAQDKPEIYDQMIGANGYFAMALFADPAEVLALSRPKSPILLAMWHYARGEALARKHDAAGVRAEAAAIQGTTAKVSKDDSSLQAQLQTLIARNVLAGRAALMDKRSSEAVIAFQQAAEIQEGPDFSSVSDSPAWYYPVRRDLAVALLQMGDRVGAKKQAAAALAYRVKDPGTLALLRKIGK